MDEQAKAVAAFWLEECTPEDWYKSDPAFDQMIRDRFESLWHEALNGGLCHWQCSAMGALAYCILTDQLPRNMFRGEARAFATDTHARGAAKRAIKQKFDLKVDEPGRQFFYLPLEHSESLPDQGRAVSLIAERMNAPETLLHAQAHREVIRRFGRFPFRNAALGRQTSEGEAAFLEAGAYGAIVRELRAA